MSDPILDSMFDGEEFDEESGKRDFDPSYGVGRHPNAVLVEVTPGKTSDFSRTIMLKVNLDGEGKPFTVFADAPFLPEQNGDPDKYERNLKGYQVGLNKLKTLVHATGQWVEFNERGYKEKTTWPKSFADFKDDETFNKLVLVFQQLVGSKMPINVKVRNYTKRDGTAAVAKDVWGLDPKQD